MSPQYLAGLYDGEGHGSIVRGPVGHRRVLVGAGFCVDQKHCDVIVDYLSNNNIGTYITYPHNKLGESCRIDIRQSDVETFVNMIFPYSIFKQERLKIILKAENFANVC